MTDITQLAKQAGFVEHNYKDKFKTLIANPEKEIIDGYFSVGDELKIFAQLLRDKFMAELGEPVAYVITDKNINGLQVDSIKALVERCKHAHFTDLHIRVNGEWEIHQADWVKYMHIAPPPLYALKDERE